MERRVAFVRAVNVGGSGTLRMDRLRKVAAKVGWRDVSTLGASGNVLYTAGRTREATDEKNLGAALAGDLGKPAQVIVRSHADLKALVKANPFSKVDATIPRKWWFVGFLAAESNDKLPEVVEGAPLAYAGRRAREVCWTMSAPDRRAIDHPKRIERAFGIPMTVRNWNVVNELVRRTEGA